MTQNLKILKMTKEVRDRKGNICSVLITTPLVGGRGGSDWETLAKIFFLITTPPSGGTDLVKM